MMTDTNDHPYTLRKPTPPTQRRYLDVDGHVIRIEERPQDLIDRLTLEQEKPPVDPNAETRRIVRPDDETKVYQKNDQRGDN